MLDTDHIANGLDHRYAPVLSALPNNQSATTVRFNVQPGNAGTNSDRAWLGYAVFHPETARTSSFTDLDLDLLGVALDRLDVFLSLAIGNNLPTESGQSPFPRNTTYEMARVQATTTAHTEPRDAASVLWTFPSETTLTLCAARAGRE